MNDLHWLDPWLPLLATQARGLPLLELGCGTGRDTATLLQAGHRVTALDLDAASIAEAQARAPAARLLCQDLRAPWPAPPERAPAYGAVIASLSLHYFPWAETMALVQRLHDSLAAGGLLLCRLNSTRDTHYGAVGHPEIEPHYYRVDGAPKRFFDEADVHQLFGDARWRWIELREVTIDRYEHPKVAWLLVAERVA